MSKQLSTSRRTVVFATVVLILATAAFGASFYLLDGATVVVAAYSRVSDMVTGLIAGDGAAPVTPAPAGSAESTLTVPTGMQPEFALRLWQEQVDSQATIARLVSGEAVRLTIDKVIKDGADTRLDVTVYNAEGVDIKGAIGLRRYGNIDYVAYMASEEDRIPPAGALPDVSDVDVALLSTMLKQNAASEPVISEYIGGVVKEVVVTKRTEGPRTMTIDLTMKETHGTGYARLVLVRSDKGGQNRWFITRFKKTGHDPANL